MTRLEFERRMDAASGWLGKEKSCALPSIGLCAILNYYVGFKAKRAFNDKYDALNWRSILLGRGPYFLGNRKSDKGRARRVNFLAKFRKYVIKKQLYYKF